MGFKIFVKVKYMTTVAQKPEEERWKYTIIKLLHVK